VKGDMKTIGILGGLGPESTISYYGYITRRYYELHKDYAYPDIVIYSMSFREFIETGYELPERVKGAIESLEKAGADFVVASCNSVHIVYDQVVGEVSIPWVSIMDATAEQVKKAQMKKVGLLGTIFTMSRGFYVDAFARQGIEMVLPDDEGQKRVSQIIYDELVRAEVKDESRDEVLGIIEGLKAQGAEGIVLGCTELPFLIRQEDTEMRVFDTTTIHAQKALDLALEG